MFDRTTSITAATRFCAVYGHPIRHSASPAMQNAGIAELDLPWRYIAFDVHPDELRAAIDGARAMRFIGLNLTVPHKLLALEMVDDLDSSAAMWGAVNTIRFEAEDAQGRWQPLALLDPFETKAVRAKGFNTDADAIVRSIEEDLGLSLAGKSVLLLGAGGAGRVAALRMAAEQVRQLHMINRSRDKAEAVAEEIRSRHPGVQVSLDYPIEPVDLVLNATSLGLNPSDPLPIDPARFPLEKAAAAYDMIYRPAETAFLKAARMSGCRCANGIGMLLYQGAKALEIWSGQTAPIPVMRSALEENIYARHA